MTASNHALFRSNSSFSDIVAVLKALAPWPRLRTRYLDPRDFSDHLKRDMGILDGKVPPSGR